MSLFFLKNKNNDGIIDTKNTYVNIIRKVLITWLSDTKLKHLDARGNLEMSGFNYATLFPALKKSAAYI